MSTKNYRVIHFLWSCVAMSSILCDVLLGTKIFFYGYLVGATFGLIYMIWIYAWLESTYSSGHTTQADYVHFGLFQTVVRLFLILVVSSWFGITYMYYVRNDRPFTTKEKNTEQEDTEEEDTDENI